MKVKIHNEKYNDTIVFDAEELKSRLFELTEGKED